MPSGPNDKRSAILVESRLVQGDVFLVFLLVCNIDHCDPVSLLCHCFYSQQQFSHLPAEGGPPDVHFRCSPSMHGDLPLILLDHTTRTEPKVFFFKQKTAYEIST